MHLIGFADAPVGKVISIELRDIVGAHDHVLDKHHIDPAADMPSPWMLLFAASPGFDSLPGMSVETLHPARPQVSESGEHMMDEATLASSDHTRTRAGGGNE
jgi:hypothetical protein